MRRLSSVRSARPMLQPPIIMRKTEGRSPFVRIVKILRPSVARRCSGECIEHPAPRIGLAMHPRSTHAGGDSCSICLTERFDRRSAADTVDKSYLELVRPFSA